MIRIALSVLLAFPAAGWARSASRELEGLANEAGVPVGDLTDVPGIPAARAVPICGLVGYFNYGHDFRALKPREYYSVTAEGPASVILDDFKTLDDALRAVKAYERRGRCRVAARDCRVGTEDPWVRGTAYGVYIGDHGLVSREDYPGPADAVLHKLRAAGICAAPRG